jgi:EAL domain-containing protein (putative c-di-GMP-specific phosphodiesterase class I)
MTSLGIRRPAARRLKRQSAGIVRALAGLSQGLGFAIAAEGVDGADQETSLIQAGCEQGQGGLFRTPMDAARTYRLFEGRQTRAG